MNAFEARDLCKSVRLATGERLALIRSVNFQVAAGESLGIVGRSGSGKSTLLALAGLLTIPDTGDVVIDGHVTSQLSDRSLSALRNQRIGFVFQNYSLLAHLSAAENVALPLLHGPRLSRTEIHRRTEAALASVGLAERSRSRPRHLSGGEQQRTAIARALVRTPAVILADEPTGALDTDTATHVLDTLIGAARDEKAALVIVTHDPLVAGRMSRVLRLDDGTLVRERQVS